MKTFKQHQSDPDDLDESFLRGASALVLFNKIHKIQQSIKRAKTTDLAIQLLAKQNTLLAALIFAMTQLPPETDRKGKS